MKASSDDGRLHVRVPKDLLKRLKVECARRETTMQKAVEQALRDWLRAGGER
jgi:predicted HicB family RNase H-like nuclease